MAEEPAGISIDFANGAGSVRALNGINKGPLCAGGLMDLTEQQRALAPQSIRLHDCHWPTPDVVDFHAVFPNPDADPALPESYDFRLTDEYIAAARATGAEIIYRLGQSIEHTTTRRFVHPPRDPDKWARIAVGIIRHYNEGWANGHRYGIRYWEIWNEPDVRPAMWSGTDADYFRLYEVAAKAIRARFADVKIAGPATCDAGGIGGDGAPSPFTAAFLDYCRAHSLPLDVFTWHCYTADYATLAVRARSVRRFLDDHGYQKTVSCLDEWNFLPNNDWSVMGNRTGSPEARRRFYQRMSGAEGAAFAAAALIDLQDAPVDMCCYYHGETGAFGMFDEYAVPAKNYYAMLAFGELLRTPRRAKVTGAIPGKLAVCAGAAADAATARILMARIGSEPADCAIELTSLPWAGAARYDVRLVDAATDLAVVTAGAKLGADRKIAIPWNGPCVVLVTLRPDGPSAPTH